MTTLFITKAPFRLFLLSLVAVQFTFTFGRTPSATTFIRSRTVGNNVHCLAFQTTHFGRTGTNLQARQRDDRHQLRRQHFSFIPGVGRTLKATKYDDTSYGPFEEGDIGIARPCGKHDNDKEKSFFSLYYRIYNHESKGAPLLVVHGGPYVCMQTQLSIP